MVVHAHPDDEVFRTAGIQARYAEAGDRVVVVYATRGEAGDMHLEGVDPEEAKARLGEIREEEARVANAILGPQEIYYLGYRDSGVTDSEENKRLDAFMNAPIDEAADRLVAIMRETEPQVVVGYPEGGDYQHPDHAKAHEVVLAAFEKARKEPWGPKKLYYTASSRQAFKRYVEGITKLGLKIPWFTEDSNPDDWGGMEDSEITAHVDIAPWAARKKAALAAHRSQIPADFFYLSLPDEAFSEYSGVEFYVRAIPPPEPGEHEDDLFAGLEGREAAA